MKSKYCFLRLTKLMTSVKTSESFDTKFWELETLDISGAFFDFYTISTYICTSLPDLLQHYIYRGGGLPNLLQYYIGMGLKSLLQYCGFERKMEGYNPFSALN